MCDLTTAGLEPGLSIDEVETRLIEAARRHHREERRMAYWLLEVQKRRLYEKRGFSSVGDYAMELVGLSPRKARYLVFIAGKLEVLPRVAAAFDSGELSWTKAREIVRVATPDTEADWLERARLLSNRELEREVRALEGREREGFVTVTIAMPAEYALMLNECHEMSERLFGMELEKWQGMEPMMAEYLSTYLAEAQESRAVASETEDEKALPASVRDAVFERDGWRCAFPGCTARKRLDPHHVEYKSHGGSDELENLVCLCRLHHELVHRGICSISGRVGVDLKFERPRLVSEPERRPPEEAEREDGACEASPEAPVAAPDVAQDQNDVAQDPDTPDEVDDESWREETVAAIFDGPPSPEPPRRQMHWGDIMLDWAEPRPHGTWRPEASPGDALSSGGDSEESEAPRNTCSTATKAPTPAEGCRALVEHVFHGRFRGHEVGLARRGPSETSVISVR